MKEVMIEGEGMNKQGRTVWMWRGGGSSDVATLLRNVHRENEAPEIMDKYNNIFHTE